MSGEKKSSRGRGRGEGVRREGVGGQCRVQERRSMIQKESPLKGDSQTQTQNKLRLEGNMEDKKNMSVVGEREGGKVVAEIRKGLEERVKLNYKLRKKERKV